MESPTKALFECPIDFYVGDLWTTIYFSFYLFQLLSISASIYFSFNGMLSRLSTYLREPISIAPLAVFRISFGLLMALSMLRFMAKGWVCELYVEPGYYFTYWGFGWVKPLGELGMHALYLSLLISAVFVMLGAWYRFSITWFFLAFSYAELIDKTNYLNHYYFVSLVAFLLMWVPAHAAYSLDAWRRPGIQRTQVPRWQIGMFRVQLGLVYVYAGVAKLVPDWLFRALPLKIWLAPMAYKPVLGWLFTFSWTPYLFSWFGALYDLTIPFWLMWKRSRGLAYAAVIAFHLMTALLFPIGMFPYIMIVATLIFFPVSFHEGVLQKLEAVGKKGLRWLESLGIHPLAMPSPASWAAPSPSVASQPLVRLPRTLRLACLGMFFATQLLLPWRFMLYPGNLFWTEQGYRFSWRVMLMEKDGVATFTVRDPQSGQRWEVHLPDYLSKNQEKMMSTQPDMLLQFAHYLDKVYREKGIADPEVYVSCYVSLNGRRSRPFVDPKVDLSRQARGLHPKAWILPFQPDQLSTAYRNP